MKKIVVLVCFIAAIGLTNRAMAQAEMAIGVKGGLNFAKVNVDNFSADNKTGFHGGAFALFKFSKIGIQPELIFSKQGSSFKFNTTDIKANYSYINIPILLKLYTVAGINIQVGPQFGFVASAKQDITDTASNIKSTEDVKDQLKGSDISAALGLGWDLPFGLSIDARYNLGLTKINDSGSGDAKNQVIQVSVGYKLFKLGK